MNLKLFFTKKNKQKKPPEQIFQEWFDAYWNRLVDFCEHHCNDEQIAIHSLNAKKAYPITDKPF